MAGGVLPCLLGGGIVKLNEVVRSKQRGGYYTVPEAARLLRLDNTATIRNWVFGNVKREPIIDRQYDGSRDEVGFYDLLEVRFVSFFRRQGVSLQSLRRAAKTARAELHMHHPFATSLKFVAERKRIFMITGEQEKDRKLLELTEGQFAFYDVLENTLAKGIMYDAGTELARLWRPEPEKYPHIVLNPHRANGLPTLEPKGVPTRTLHDLFRAEGNSYEAVADWFEVDVTGVKEAVAYEIEISNEPLVHAG
jgi:uncharacterized protein (DUF433 family)